MSKKLLSALILIALTFIVLLFNRGSVGVDLIVTSFNGFKPLVFFGFTALGVVLGVLLT